MMIRRTHFPMLNRAVAAFLATSAVVVGLAHETGHDHPHDVPVARWLPMVTEKKGPIRAPARLKTAPPQVTGQGFWKFVPLRDGVLPLPEETKPFVKGAHGTILVDAPRDVVYWGLEKVGWVAFNGGLASSAVIQGDPAFARGNLHGADLLPRKGALPLVAVADNVEGEVYLSDTSFARAETLKMPAGGPYADQKGFAPTDVAFTAKQELYVTDGYGKAYFMPTSLDPLRYQGPMHGGKEFSQTPHGITYDPSDRSLLLSARPEAQVKRWSMARRQVMDIAGLPAGSTVCDVDLWGDYALAPCLDGPNQSPGPIYIINLKKRAIVSVLRPKQDLGFDDAQHIHDAAWYLRPNGRKQELVVLFTNWNPGGIGALKLVNLPD